MKLAFVSLVLLPLSSGAETWTLRSGRTFDAELAAADGLRATFTAEGKTPAVVPLADLTDQSRGVVAKWRADWFRPLCFRPAFPHGPPRRRLPPAIPKF